MIEKKGNWQVDKLRIILLYKADFNFLNRKLGREALRQAETYNQVTAEQYGSRRSGQHWAIRQALNKKLTFDIIQQYRIPAVMYSNDIKSCYNQILHLSPRCVYSGWESRNLGWHVLLPPLSS